MKKIKYYNQETKYKKFIEIKKFVTYFSIFRNILFIWLIIYENIVIKDIIILIRLFLND